MLNVRLSGFIGNVNCKKIIWRHRRDCKALRHASVLAYRIVIVSFLRLVPVDGIETILIA